MEDRNLPNALCDSITEEAGNAVADILEVGLDSIFEDGLLKDVPLLSTATSLYKIGHSIIIRIWFLRFNAEYIPACQSMDHLCRNPCISDFQFYNFPSHIGFSLMGKISDQYFFHGNTSIFYFLTCLKFLIRRLRQFFL